ncbi:MAG: glycosyltransferase family 4 protein [Gammaproteobacteria bacterium]
MNVLALVTDAFGGDGGIARFNRDLLGAIARMPEVGRVDVLCRHAPRRVEAPPAKVVQATAGGGRAGFALHALARAATRRYHLVLCGHLHLAPVAAVIARLRRIPLWVQLYGIEAWQRPGFLRARAMQHATLVTVISRHTRARFLEWSELEADRVRVLPCTVDARFTPGSRPSDLAKRLGVENRRVALTVSRIDRGDRYKGHETVLRSLAAVASRLADLDYVIAGDGDDRPRLEQVAKDLGLGDRVHFAGHVGDSELIDYYRLADVFVMPSAKEGFGIVFLEAAATGLPVIGGNRDGSADPLADGAIGTLVAPEDEGALAAAIEAALRSPRPDARRAERFAAAEFRRHVQSLLGRLDERRGLA